MHVPLDERARRWVAAAADDLTAARALEARVPHLACFHAQQAAEKALKALVTRLSGDAPQAHVVARLFRALDELAAAVPRDVRDDGESLDKFYVAPRYPDALGFADASLAYKPRDAALATAAAQTVLAWVRSALDDARARDPNPP